MLRLAEIVSQAPSNPLWTSGDFFYIWNLSLIITIHPNNQPDYPIIDLYNEHFNDNLPHYNFIINSDDTLSAIEEI